jgi:polyhydroxyalkanoate synthesis regulator phasin
MSREEKLKRYQDAGAELIEQARQRAEDFLREVSNIGGSTQQQASAKVDDLLGAGRWGADQLIESIRKEIASQLSSLGLATKADLVALERRLATPPEKATRPAKKARPAVEESPAAPAPVKAAPVKKAPVTKVAPVAKSPAKKAVAKKTAAKKTVAKKAAAAKKTTSD